MKIQISQQRIYLFSYFIGIILVGSLLLMLPISWNGSSTLYFIDALFTSTSAVCVTGLITVDTALYSQFGKIVISFLIQLGGLGIVTFTTIFIALPRKKISLVNRSVIKDYYIDEIEYDPKKIMQHIILMTFSLELIGAVFLFIGFYNKDPSTAFFNSIFHSISAFCNAGFSTYSDSLESFTGSTIINFAIMFLIVTGGLGFLVLQDIGRIIKRKKRRLATYSKIVIKTTFILLFIGAVAFFIIEYNNSLKELNLWEKIMASLFQSVTTRTAGFDTIPQFNFSSLAITISILLMLIGGSSGSTAGGIKTNTFYVIVMSAIKGVNEKNSLVVKKRFINTETILKAYSILIKAIFVIIVSSLLIVIFENFSTQGQNKKFYEIVFEVVSAFATVGLSLGITAKLCLASKIVLILTMFIGRVGLVALAWKVTNNSIEKYTDFPETKVMLG